MADPVFRVRREGTTALLMEIRGRSRDMRPYWPSAFAHMARETNDLFEHMGHDGGTYRGVYWAGFAPQYVRSDGPVPAEGGVPRMRAGMSTRSLRGGRLRTGIAQDIVTRRFVGGRSTGGEGLVRGKLRPSGTRVGPDSDLVQDTGGTRIGATSNYRATARRLVMYIPSSVGYARRQHAMRPILFMTDRDVDKISEDALDYVFGGSATAPGQAVAPAGSMLERLRQVQK